MDKVVNISIAIKFVEMLNRRDFDRLKELMPDDHKLFPGGDEIINGKEAACRELMEYTRLWQDFQIHISDVYLNYNNVIFIGRSTNSCEQVPSGVEIKTTRIYYAKVEDGLVAEFHHEDDNESNRRSLGVKPENKIT
ncbi:nuclear transport factor 2 family protein [bacterium]|nr:nuclear transport factor 2 family protein [bacterium]